MPGADAGLGRAGEPLPARRDERPVRRRPARRGPCHRGRQRPRHRASRQTQTHAGADRVAGEAGAGAEGDPHHLERRADRKRRPFVRFGGPSEDAVRSLSAADARRRGLRERVLEAARAPKPSPTCSPAAARSRCRSRKATRGSMPSSASRRCWPRLPPPPVRTSGLKPVTTERRDLFKLPVTRPGNWTVSTPSCSIRRARGAGGPGPSAGAIEGAAHRLCLLRRRQLRPRRRILVNGYQDRTLSPPVDQFLWSGHIELVAGFPVRR